MNKTPKEITANAAQRSSANLSAEMKHFIRFVAQMNETDFQYAQAHAIGIVETLDRVGADENDYVIIREPHAESIVRRRPSA